MANWIFKLWDPLAPDLWASPTNFTPHPGKKKFRYSLVLPKILMMQFYSLQFHILCAQIKFPSWSWEGRVIKKQLYVTGRRTHVRPYKVYIFVISATRKIDLAISVRLSVRLSVMSRQHFSDTIRATNSKFWIDTQSMWVQNAIK